jgi:outer membrane protein OmpA-like peptidoglycan-associated protein
MTSRKIFRASSAAAVLSLALSAGAFARPPETAREILSLSYPLGDTISVELRGTSRLPDGDGEAKVERKSGATEIEIELDDMKPADWFGGDYNTYVLWAVSPEGQTDNLGELILRGDRSKLYVTTRLDTFGLLVSAEPHFMVGSPSPFVVLENVRFDEDASGIRTARVPYSGFEGIYRFDRASLDHMKESDRKVYPHLEEARTAVALAERSGAERYAEDELDRARGALLVAEASARSGDDREDLLPLAHEAVRLAMSAQVMGSRAASEAALARAIEEKESVLQAREMEIAAKERQIRDLEIQARAARSEAERATLAAEQQRLRAEIQAERADTAERSARGADADRRATQSALDARERELRDKEQRIRELQARADAAQTEAERARFRAEQEKLRAQVEADRAAEAEALARREMDERMEAEREAADARRDREEARRELQAALEQIIEVRETARGLIVNVPNVLFDLDRATLKPEGREKLAQVATILGLARGYRLSVEGHADNTGERSYNLDLSRRRAETVRDYMISKGMSREILSIEAFGEERPIASNASADGRQLNRRVEIVVEEQPEFTILVLQPTESRR